MVKPLSPKALLELIERKLHGRTSIHDWTRQGDGRASKSAAPSRRLSAIRPPGSSTSGTAAFVWKLHRTIAPRCPTHSD
jgi:hypothetical protein